MDTRRIITQEGYRREDLTEASNKVLNWCDYILEQVGNLKDNLLFIDDEAIEETIIGQMKCEIIMNTIDKTLEWIQGAINDIQICLAENEE